MCQWRDCPARLRQEGRFLPSDRKLGAELWFIYFFVSFGSGSQTVAAFLNAACAPRTEHTRAARHHTPVLDLSESTYHSDVNGLAPSPVLLPSAGFPGAVSRARPLGCWGRSSLCHADTLQIYCVALLSRETGGSSTTQTSLLVTTRLWRGLLIFFLDLFSRTSNELFLII